MLLLFACVAIGYVGGHLMAAREEHARLTFAVSTVLLLCILGIFKYFGFFVDSFHSLFAAVGLPFQKITLSLALPIAISFYTFQTIGYLADVKTKRVVPEKNLVEFALFVTFYPQLVAGPIERATNLLKQIKLPREVSMSDLSMGIYLILQGYVKKVVVADNLAPIVDGTLTAEGLSGPIVLVAMLGFAFQIYCDFSGYTDIARGISRLMGFRILLNFNHPYRSLNPTEFWRRWHITLSNWFRDYVYIPLGGNRKGSTRTNVNLFLTMVVSGFWHGASLNFILWGGYHGFLLLAHKTAINVLGRRHQALARNFFYKLACWLVTFSAVVFGWLFFRIEETDQLGALLSAVFVDWSLLSVAFLVLSQMILFVFVAVAVDFAESFFVDIESSNLKREFGVEIYLACLLLVIVTLGADSGGDFIYFRF